MKKSIKSAFFSLCLTSILFSFETSLTPVKQPEFLELEQNNAEYKSCISSFKILQPNVRLVSITPDAEKNMAYVARVSNPANQANEKIAGLLKHCIQHGHWSVFEQAFITMEIETSRAIATQILRHRSFSFQQFSQRYADNSILTEEIPMFELRSQDHKNRQNSIDNISPEEQIKWHTKIDHIFKQSLAVYQEMLNAGIAKECARFILPENMPARIYMSGSVRSWIHYIQLRSSNGTQKEHMEVANKCKEVFIEQLPIVSKALGWIE